MLTAALTDRGSCVGQWEHSISVRSVFTFWEEASLKEVRNLTRQSFTNTQTQSFLPAVKFEDLDFLRLVKQIQQETKHVLFYLQ